MSSRVPPHDYVIHQWFHLERCRPYHLFITNAAFRYDPDTAPYMFIRQRCPTCVMYTSDCRKVESRLGAQPGRLLLRAGQLFTGTFHRFNRWSECGLYEGQFGYGPCRGKESQGQIAMGNVALLPAIREGVHSDRISLTGHPDNVFAGETQCYDSDNYEMYLGPRDPDGWPPQDHYDLCLRFAINLPADAVITDVQLFLRRTEPQGAPCHTQAYLLDRDDMDPYSMAVDDPNNPSRLNPNGPSRINCHSGTNNEFAIELDNGGGAANTWLEIPAEIVQPILQAFIDRAAYVAGNHLGVVLQSNQALNLTAQNSMKIDGYSGAGMGSFLRIRWHEASADPQAPAARPPQLMAYLHQMQESSPVPPDGTWPGAEPDPIDSGGTVGQIGHDKIPDLPWAGAYRHCFLIPVDPLQNWWNPEEHGEAPYPVDAHLTFPLNDCETYEIPCFPRTLPFRYRSLGGSALPSVAAGLRGILSFSSQPAQHGFLPVYASGPQCGAPNYTGMDENTWRLYHGQTQPKRYVWQTDPQQRGWWVEYTAYQKAWYVMDADFEGFCNLRAPIGDPNSCMFRWNAWYEIHIRVNFHPRADVDDPAFRAWVLSHESGFGGVVTPRYRHCNDVLRGCGADPGNAMGDTVWPPESCQAVVEAPIGSGPNKYPPCMHNDGEPSWWYLPDYVSKHVKSPQDRFVGAYPELGLYHETKFIRNTTPDGSTTQNVYGWAILGFQTNLPWLLDASSGAPEVHNEIQRISLINPNGCNPPTWGSIILAWGEAPEMRTQLIGYWSSALEVAQMIGEIPMIGQGNVEVTGPDGGPWVVEYINDLRGRNVPAPTVYDCQVQDGNGCLYEVLIETIQQGTAAL